MNDPDIGCEPKPRLEIAIQSLVNLDSNEVAAPHGQLVGQDPSSRANLYNQVLRRDG